LVEILAGGDSAIGLVRRRLAARNLAPMKTHDPRLGCGNSMSVPFHKATGEPERSDRHENVCFPCDKAKLDLELDEKGEVCGGEYCSLGIFLNLRTVSLDPIRNILLSQSSKAK
jgi:hypothetical protein